MKFKIPNIKEIKSALNEHPTVIGLIDWSKKRSLPGFFGVPLYDILVFLRLEFKKNALQVRANSIAFSFMLALFPATIVLFTLIPFFPIEGFVDYLEKDYFKQILPKNLSTEVMNFIRDITDKTRGSLLSFSFMLAILFSSNGMMGLLQGFDKKNDYTTFLSRNVIMQRLVSIQLVFLLGSTLVLSVGLIVGGNYLIEFLANYIKADQFTKASFILIKWFAILFLFYFGISVIYRYGPALKNKFSIFSPGATLAAILCIISSWIFSFYTNNFGNYNQLYGSLGVIIVLMLWLKINAFILLIGFELNAAIAVNRDIIEAAQEED